MYVSSLPNSAQGGCRCLPLASVLVQGGVRSGICQPGLQTSCPEWHRDMKMQLLGPPWTTTSQGLCMGRGWRLARGEEGWLCRMEGRGRRGRGGPGPTLLPKCSAWHSMVDTACTCSLPATRAPPVGAWEEELCNLPDAHQYGHSSRPWAGLLGLTRVGETRRWRGKRPAHRAHTLLGWVN